MQTLFLVAEFRGKLGAKVLRFENLANLYLRTIAQRSALRPLKGFISGVHLKDPEAADHLFHIERPFSDGGIISGKVYAHYLSTGLQPLTSLHYASLYQLFVVLTHLSKKLCIRENTCLGGFVSFEQNHESHRSISFGF